MQIGNKKVIYKVFEYFQYKIEQVLFIKLFLFWQSMGFHLIKNNCYEPIPDTRDLCDDLWVRENELIGIDLKVSAQLKLLEVFSRKYKTEYNLIPEFKTKTPFEYYYSNGEFESTDAAILYCMIRHYKPKNIIEIGSGNSSYLMAQAILLNKKEEAGYKCTYTIIDPYPRATIRAGFPGITKVHEKRLQDIAFNEFNKLKINDIIFIDSSHILNIGSDVRHEYLDILPRLKKGVIVHFHDIYLPSEYPKVWVREKYRFWNEQYLLQAFLSFNKHFEVLWSGNYLHLKHPRKLESAFEIYKRRKRGTGSFWIRKIR